MYANKTLLSLQVPPDTALRRWLKHGASTIFRSHGHKVTTLFTTALQFAQQGLTKTFAVLR